MLFLKFFIGHGGLIDLVGTVPAVVNSDYGVSVKNLYSETSFQFLDCEVVHERKVLPVHKHVLVDGVVLLLIVDYIFFVPFLLELLHRCFVLHCIFLDFVEDGVLGEGVELTDQIKELLISGVGGFSKYFLQVLQLLFAHWLFLHTV